VDEPPTPPSPYREGKRLAEIIPPDRRAHKTAALVAGSMVAGVALWLIGGVALDMLRAGPAAPPVPGYVAGRVPRCTLQGPTGAITLPPKTRTVIHVWLQGCQDCMPAFEAIRELGARGGLGAGTPVVNVAYGEADVVWAQRYGVSTNLVFDPGGASVVRPLGIGTFTTLVVDPDGSIIHRDRPDRPGYEQRVRAVLDVREVEDPAAQDDGPPPDVAPLGAALDATTVARVVASHRARLTRACWDGLALPKPASVTVTVAVTVDTKGRVSQVSSSGDDPAIGRCLERQVATWTFPAPAADTRVRVPFRFATQ
jgi:hypothetical protein